MKKIVKVKDLKLSKNNMRQKGEPSVDLIESLKKDGKPIQDIICTSKLEVYVGGLRMKALKKAGVPEVEVEIRDCSPFEQKKLSVQENYLREEVDVLEYGRTLKEMRDEKKLNNAELARELSMGEWTLGAYIRTYEVFHGLCPSQSIPLEDSKDHKTLTYGKAQEILRINSDIFSVLGFETKESQEKELERVRKQLLSEVTKEGMTLKELENVIRESKAFLELSENMDSEEDSKLTVEYLKDKLWTKKMNPREMLYDIDHQVLGGSAPKDFEVYPKSILTDASNFSSEEEAHKFFEEFRGACFGKEEYYYGEVDKVLWKRYLKQRKLQEREEKKKSAKVIKKTETLRKKTYIPLGKKVTWKEFDTQSKKDMGFPEDTIVLRSPEDYRALEKKLTKEGLKVVKKKD